MALALAMARSDSIETMPTMPNKSNSSNSESTGGLGLETPARDDVVIAIDAETIPEPPKNDIVESHKMRAWQKEWPG